jgi:hypothetical protein
MEDTNIFQLIKDDHAGVDALFKDIDAAKGAARRMLTTQLAANLTVHCQAEEAVLYKRLKVNESMRERIYASEVMHGSLRQLAAQLEAPTLDDAQLTAQLKVLKDLMHHHVREEVTETLPAAMRIIDADFAQDLGAEFRAHKARLLDDYSEQEELDAAAPTNASTERASFDRFDDITEPERRTEHLGR